MLETPHVAVAAAIAYTIPNPLIAIPLALGSHFILEIVPHWNPHLNTEMRTFGRISPTSTRLIVFDAVAALLLGFFVAFRVLPDSTHFLVILFACFAGVFPDVLEAPYYFLKVKNNFIQKIWIPSQKALQNDVSPLPGLTSQALTIMAAMLWIMK